MADEILVWSPTVDPPRLGLLSLRRLALFALAALPAALVLAVVGAAHAFNMFGSPFYFDDEGIYMSQAWSVLASGKLAPYTYFYDHPPVGWFTVAGIVRALGGFDAFGASVNAGRVAMFVVHLIAALLVFRIACRLHGTTVAGLLGALLFGLSPFQILFGRQVLLDNLAALWLLVSLYLATAEQLSISGTLFSGAAMGVAFLNKEIVVPLVPGMLVVLWIRLHPELRLMGLATWLFATASLASFYPLYAFLKGELFPAGSALDFSSSPHVSLIDGLIFHQSRASDLGLFDLNSLFWNAARVWWHTDPALVVGLLGAIVMSVLLRRRCPGVLGLGVMLAGLVAFLARGGVVFEFWLLVGVPIVAIVLGLTIDHARLALGALLAHLWRQVTAPPTLLRAVGRDLRRLLANEISEAEFFRSVGLAMEQRSRRLRALLGRLVPGTLRSLASEYRGMLRGELTEWEFGRRQARRLGSLLLRLLSLPWTAPDAIIAGLEALTRRAKVRRSAPAALARLATPGPLRVAGALGVSVALIVTVALSHGSYAASYERAFQHNETEPQTRAIGWLERHAARDAFLVIDTYAFVDLREFDDAHPFWKVDLDPDVRDDILRNDWRRIDYVALTPVMSSAVGDGRLPLLAEALAHANLLQRFESRGEWVEIWRVDDTPVRNVAREVSSAKP